MGKFWFCYFCCLQFHEISIDSFATLSIVNLCHLDSEKVWFDKWNPRAVRFSMLSRVNLHISILKLKITWDAFGSGRVHGPALPAPLVPTSERVWHWSWEGHSSVSHLAAPLRDGHASRQAPFAKFVQVQWQNLQCHTPQDYIIYIGLYNTTQCISLVSKNMACLVQCQAWLQNHSLQPRCSFVNHDCLSYSTRFPSWRSNDVKI